MNADQFEQDNYKIMSFVNMNGSTQSHIHPDILAHPHRPVDELLRWHFRQAVLCNMRAAAEAPFEHDFPEGSDIMQEIMNGPRAAERMECELFERLVMLSGQQEQE
jgi:hypothetical protein